MKWWMSTAMVPAEELPDMVWLAEELGFDGVALPDSVFYPAETEGSYPFTEDGARMWVPETPMPDPLITIAALGAVTSRIRFMTTVMKLPLRDPLLLAKQVATLGVVTNDRLSLGVGLAWMPEEFRFTGTEMKTRGARSDEAIDILRAICGGGPHWAEYHGKHYDFDKLMIAPAPVTPVPVFVGGHSDAAMRRAAVRGDGWLSANKGVPELLDLIERMKAIHAEHGRADDPFTIGVSPHDRPDLEGFRRLAAAGATDCYLSPTSYYGQRGADLPGRLAAIRRFAEEFIDKV